MISITTPVLNGARFIEKNIQSIQKLTIPYEHIIVDGGSTDGTLEILNKYPHLKVLHQTEKTGMYGGIDIGFKNSIGQYICWVNCDDYIIANNFEKMYNYANKSKSDFINSDSCFYLYRIRKHKAIKGSRFCKYFLKKGILPFVQPSSIYTHDLYNKVGGFNLKYKIAGDIDLFYRMSQLENIKFNYLPLKTTVFLKYGDSLGDNNSEKAIKEREEANIPIPDMITRLLFKISKLL